MQSWRSPDGRRGNAVYTGSSLEALQAFVTHPAQLEAKCEYARWYAGYRVVIAEVLREYGDGRLGTLADAAKPSARH